MTNQKTSLSKAMLLGVGSLLLSEILCLFVAFSCAMLAVSLPAAKWFSILCTTGIHLGLMADYAVKIARRDRVEERRFQLPHRQSRPFWMGLASVAPLILLWGLLMLCRLCSLGDFLPAYRLLNAHYFQLLNLLTGSGTLGDVSMGRLLLIPVFFLVTFLCIVGAYWAGYSGKSASDLQYEA
ncbi:hypothetical protein [Ruminococcus sp.]|uniref:hypothetical protein n=1 Tax=Ruminococcus sp. TaxID=41978 RepID=UPI0025EF93CE|nr:hypothetical protein [Ruminococcus sp.]MCI5817164.1 hypothetical protein [Ruminococcus sp.]